MIPGGVNFFWAGAHYLATAHYNLSRLYDERGERGKALHHARLFVDLFSETDDPDVQANLHRSRERIRRLEAAVATGPETVARSRSGG